MLGREDDAYTEGMEILCYSRTGKSDGTSRPIALLLHPLLVPGKYLVAGLGEICADYHVIAPDFSGHGTAHNMEFTDFANEIRQLQGYLKQQNISHIDLVLGMSMGARCALQFISEQSSSGAGDLTFGCVIFDGPPLIPHIWGLGPLLGQQLVRYQRRAVADPVAAGAAMRRRFGRMGQVMAESVQHISGTSLRSIILACTRGNYPPIPAEVQRRLFIEFGERELAARWRSQVKRHYPQATVTVHEGLGHCQLLGAYPGHYRRMIREHVAQATGAKSAV